MSVVRWVSRMRRRARQNVTADTRHAEAEASAALAALQPDNRKAKRIHGSNRLRPQILPKKMFERG
jgi:hypothetical protein